MYLKKCFYISNKINTVDFFARKESKCESQGPNSPRCTQYSSFLYKPANTVAWIYLTK